MTVLNRYVPFFHLHQIDENLLTEQRKLDKDKSWKQFELGNYCKAVFHNLRKN
jgi:hypothetical protein